jgi:hypothetical protein
MRSFVLAIIVCFGSVSLAQTTPSDPAQSDDQEVPPHGVEPAPPPEVGTYTAQSPSYGYSLPAPMLMTPRRRAQRDAGIGLLTVGSAATAASAAIGASMLGIFAGCFEGGPGCPSGATVDRLGYAAIGLAAVGVPLAITGAVLLAKSRKRETRLPLVSVGPMTTGVAMTVAGSF